MSAARGPNTHVAGAARAVSMVVLALASSASMAVVDVDSMWRYDDPAASEQRFREAIEAGAKGDDALVLRTQIARTYSLRNRFDDAHAELDRLAPALTTAGPEPQVRALLERGRTLRSANDPAGARPYFEQALAIARPASLAALEADALHMIALVEPSPEGRVMWNRRVVELAASSSDPAVQAWSAPALNNLGVELNAQGRHEEALAVLREAQTAYEARGKPASIRIARWMVAHTLRLLTRRDEALAMQLQLERDNEVAGEPDPYVFEELALLYDALGDGERASRYRQRQQAASVEPAKP